MSLFNVSGTSPSATKISLADQTKPVRQIVQVHAKHVYRAQQLFGNDLAPSRFDRREGLAVFEAGDASGAEPASARLSRVPPLPSC